ncbi:MAG TPA: hypothetical protein DIC52_17345 [Candidatus Latescibacteria bacterium]|nr:hypothetical protein [Candidatus Latescibacterota bacterium]
MADHFEEIEKLGGVDLQFITHGHDLNPAFHAEAYDRFRCKLCYHKAAAAVVRKKTQCPAQEFGHDGLQLGADFEAIYFPGHTPGHSVYRWRRSGTRFLFTGHVMIFDGGRWKLNYNPTKAPKGTQFDHLAEAEHFLPTHAYGTEEFHTLNKRTRALFLEAVKQAWDAPKPSDRDVF